MANPEKGKKPHYSEKGGHLIRGMFTKSQREIQKMFPDLYSRAPVTVNGGVNQVLIFRQRSARRDGR